MVESVFVLWYLTLRPHNCLPHILKRQMSVTKPHVPGYFTTTENIYFDMFLFQLYTKTLRERERERLVWRKGGGVRRENKSCLGRNNMKLGGSLIWQHDFYILNSLEGWKLLGLMARQIWAWPPKEPESPGCQRAVQESSNPWIIQANIQQPIRSPKQAGLSS